MGPGRHARERGWSHSRRTGVSPPLPKGQLPGGDLQGCPWCLPCKQRGTGEESKSFQQQAWFYLLTRQHKGTRVLPSAPEGGGGRGRGLPAAWGPQNHSWILDSLTRPAVCGVTQVLLSPPAGEKTILSCPVVILALLPQSWDMVPHDPS